MKRSGGLTVKNAAFSKMSINRYEKLKTSARELVNELGIRLDDEKDISRVAEIYLAEKNSSQIAYATQTLFNPNGKARMDFLSEFKKFGDPL